MRKWMIGAGVVLGAVGVWLWMSRGEVREMSNPMGEYQVKEKPYDKYSFSRLVEREDIASQIEIEGETFSYMTEGKKVTGAITLPTGPGPEGGWPVVVMLRGYADKEIYYTGYGTKNGAKYFSEQGYVTLAPDFLGYGGSDPSDEDTLGARVRKPATVLDLLASLSSLEYVDTEQVYLWGHSNGGQIALSVAEILGRRGELSLRGWSSQVKGVTLWAPVTKPFPYSILYYTYDWDDRGKELRRVIAKWEADYEAEDYSIERYWDWIQTPIQIHQGTADEAVPYEWSDEVVKVWEELELDVNYYRYSGTNHNMQPSWNTVIGRDVGWFAKLSRE